MKKILPFTQFKTNTLAMSVAVAVNLSMVGVEVQAARNHHVGRVRGKFAKHVPLLGKAFAKRTQVVRDLAYRLPKQAYKL